MKEKRKVPFIPNNGFPLLRKYNKAGRNNICFCGSGKKLKHCHLNEAQHTYFQKKAKAEEA